MTLPTIAKSAFVYAYHATRETTTLRPKRTCDRMSEKARGHDGPVREMAVAAIVNTAALPRLPTTNAQYDRVIHAVATVSRAMSTDSKPSRTDKVLNSRSRASTERGTIANVSITCLRLMIVSISAMSDCS